MNGYFAAAATSSPCLKFQPLATRSRVRASRLQVEASLLHPKKILKAALPFSPLLAKPTRRVVSLAASHEDSRPEKDKDELGPDGSEEAWKQALESFKEQALKMKSFSEEAYVVYSQKAMVVLQEASEQFKVQADKTTSDLSVLAQEISEESKEYLSVVAENSPEQVKEIVETYSTSTGKVTAFSELRDFHVGIPDGFLLALVGFLHFMLTGSTGAIRFGVILGCALLALSVQSLKAQQKGESPALFLKGQAAVTGIIFLRELWLLFQGGCFINLLLAVIRGAIAAFFLYRIKLDSGQGGSPDMGYGSEN